MICKNHFQFIVKIFLALLLFFGSKELYCQKLIQTDETFAFKLLQEKIAVSPHLIGFNTVYPYESDSIWSEGIMDGYLKEVNASVLRYPGGTVCTFYHWKNLTGEGWKDSWDPNNPVIPKSKSSYMDLDEFISHCTQIKATPLLGINMSSGRRWNRLDDGLKEAIDLMKYCRGKKFSVKYWYLDNEPYQYDSNGGSKTIEEYAELVNLYSKRMKDYDPGIKIIVNWNSAFKNRREDYIKLFKIAGANFDIVDVHWYWSWNKPDFQKWLSKTPMGPWSGETYVSEIAYFHNLVKEFGYPNIKLASLEWNVGPIKEKQVSLHQCALIQSEMLMQFMQGGLDMATFWPLQGAGASVQARSFVGHNDRAVRPVYPLIKFLGQIQGNYLYKTVESKKKENVYYLVSTDQKGEEIRVCFLNKNTEDINVAVETDVFKNMKLKDATAFVLTNQGNSSDLIRIKLISQSSEGISFSSSKISLTMLTFEKNK